MKKLLLITLIGLFFTSCTSVPSEQVTKKETEKEVHKASTEAQVMMDVVVNLEGVITEVSKDGKSFRLESGTWIITDKQTEMGISGPNALPKDKQYFEPSFRKGNSIAGFSDTPNGQIIVAQVIYTNWNWEDPIRF